MIQTTLAMQRFSDGIIANPGDMPGVGGPVVEYYGIKAGIAKEVTSPYAPAFDSYSLFKWGYGYS